MLRFKGADLAPVLSEAFANQCQLILVKDQGVYMMSEKGEALDGSERRKHLAYAQGCNPDIDDFDEWWNRAQNEMGGDDCAEYFDPRDGFFSNLLSGQNDLLVEATSTKLDLSVVAADTPL